MSGALDFEKDIKKQLKGIEAYRKVPEDRAAYDAFDDRREYLKAHRRNTGIEDIWSAADKAYVPHKISSKGTGRKVLVSDDELGWRSAPVNLSAEDEWQEDSVPPNPYIKIQTALGIIVDSNPKAVLSPGKKQYENNNLLMEQLYTRSWEIAKSKSAALKPFVFNAAKYGIGVARTYPFNLTRKVEDLIQFNATDPRKSKYNDVDQTYFNDAFRESLNPWTAWFDDAARVGDPFSMNDWIWYKDYSWSKLQRSFGHLQNFKYIKPQKKVLIPLDGRTSEKGLEAKYQERIWFWESLDLDLLFIMTEDGIVLVNEPMPQQPKNKRLSCWTAPWTLRDDVSINGIGVYEAMRNDHKAYTKVRAMTLDQLVLSIYREWFYSGTDMQDGDGIMRTRPGKGRQVSDPKNMKWNEIPGPGQEAWLSLDFLQNRIDEATAISKNLEGQVTGKTAFEISQARENSMKRLKTPLENITDALENDAYITLGIIEDLYSVPKIKLIANDSYIEAAQLSEYEREDGTELVEGQDYKLEYREVPLEVERDNTGAIMKSDKNKFFEVAPKDVQWEGVIKVQGQSIVANSEILDRSTTVELANIVVPLFTAPPQLAMKPAKEILKAYKKDPEDWLPDAWLNPPPETAPAGPNLFVDPNSPEGQGEAPVNPAGGQAGIPALMGGKSMPESPSGISAPTGQSIEAIMKSMG